MCGRCTLPGPPPHANCITTMPGAPIVCLRAASAEGAAQPQHTSRVSLPSAQPGPAAADTRPPRSALLLASRGQHLNRRAPKGLSREEPHLSSTTSEVMTPRSSARMGTLPTLALMAANSSAPGPRFHAPPMAVSALPSTLQYPATRTTPRSCVRACALVCGISTQGLDTTAGPERNSHGCLRADVPRIWQVLMWRGCDTCGAQAEGRALTGKAAEVVDARLVVELERARHAAAPPVVLFLLVLGPLVQRAAPQLPCGHASQRRPTHGTAQPRQGAGVTRGAPIHPQVRS